MVRRKKKRRKKGKREIERGSKAVNCMKHWKEEKGKREIGIWRGSRRRASDGLEGKK